MPDLILDTTKVDYSKDEPPNIFAEILRFESETGKAFWMKPNELSQLKPKEQKWQPKS